MIIKNGAPVRIAQAGIILYLASGLVIFAAFINGALSYYQAAIVMIAATGVLVLSLVLWEKLRKKLYNKKDSSISEKGRLR